MLVMGASKIEKNTIYLKHYSPVYRMFNVQFVLCPLVCLFNFLYRMSPVFTLPSELRTYNAYITCVSFVHMIYKRCVGNDKWGCRISVYKRMAHICDSQNILH